MIQKESNLNKILTILILTTLLIASVPGLENTTKETTQIEETKITNTEYKETPQTEEENEEDNSNKTIEIDEQNKEVTKVQENSSTKEIKDEPNQTKEEKSENTNTTIKEEKTTSNINNASSTNNENETIQSIKETINTKTSQKRKINHSEELEYIDLEELINETKTKEVNVTKEKENNKEKNHIFYEQGKKAFEITTDKEVPEITKEESRTETGKEVVISSKEHVTTPLRVYSNLDEEAEKEEITIIWENEGTKIQNIKYYDENDNGKIDRVSWIVPHLSIQVFKIIIDTNVIEDVNESSITIEGPGPLGQQTNPVNFNFNVTYNNTGNVNCSLFINESYITSGFLENKELDLQNGGYTWLYICTDTNSSEVEEKTGSFTINEGFDITNLQNMYLKLWDGGIKDKNIVQIVSDNGGNVTGEITKPTGLPTSLPEKQTPYEVTIDKNIINSKGTYRFNLDFDNIENAYQENFYVTEINLDHPSTAKTGEEITITLDIDSQNTPEDIQYTIVFFGDGSTDTTYYSQSLQKINPAGGIKKTYTTPGTYTIEVAFKVDGKDYKVSRKTITVTSAQDNEEPSIDLQYPADEQIVTEKVIDFEFTVSDNIKLDSCNFSIYNVSVSNNLWTYNSNSRVYQDEIKNPGNPEEYIIELTDFDNREYAWEVECKDNNSNYDYEVQYFTYGQKLTTKNNFTTTNVDDIDYERKEDVRALLEAATNFIEQEDSFSKDEISALEDLKILEDVKYYKKRLLDIEQTLAKNLNFIEDTNLREKRRQESLDEIDTISESMPTEFFVKDTYEYVKNGITFSWPELVQEYLDETGTKVSSSITALAEENKELQKDLSVSTTIKEIEIKYYNDDKEEMMIVSKELRIKNESTDKILEVIPKRLLDEKIEVEFLGKATEIENNHIYEIKLEDIEDEKIVYTIKEQIDPEDLEEIDTVLFTEKTNKKKLVNTISGFLVLGGNADYEINNGLFILILILAAIILGGWIFTMAKKVAMKRNPNIFRILDLLDQIRKNLRENNINDARENYNKIKEQYNVLDPKDKKKVFTTIKKAQSIIDKKDIFGLVKEYKEAKNKFEKDEATRIYTEVQKIYKRLAKKDQLKVIKELGL